MDVLRQTYGERFDDLTAHAFSISEQAMLMMQLFQMRGDHAAEQRVIDQLRQRLAAAEQPRFPTRALVMAWSGHAEESLDELLRWTRKGHSPFWWYVFDHDPTWQRFRDDPRFIQAMTQERDYVTHQRATLEALRRQNVVPMRGRIPGDADQTARR